MSLFRKISETVSKGVSSATEKAQQTVEVTRLHSQISGKRKEIERLYTEIGEAVFEGYLAKDLSLAESRVIPACEEVAAIRGEIYSLDERIMQLRNEKECVCGRKVSYDTRFCPSCGHKFPEPQIAADEEPAVPVDKKPPYEGDFTSADPFAEPPGVRETADSPSASDWADVGMPTRTNENSADGWQQPADEWADPGLPPRGGRGPGLTDWTPPGSAVPDYSTETERADEPAADKALCTSCGTLVDPAARFCPSCGTPQH